MDSVVRFRHVQGMFGDARVFASCENAAPLVVAPPSVAALLHQRPLTHPARAKSLEQLPMLLWVVA
jgi:hypothetical protein